MTPASHHHLPLSTLPPSHDLRLAIDHCLAALISVAETSGVEASLVLVVRQATGRFRCGCVTCEAAASQTGLSDQDCSDHDRLTNDGNPHHASESS